MKVTAWCAAYHAEVCLTVVDVSVAEQLFMQLFISSAVRGLPACRGVSEKNRKEADIWKRRAQEVEAQVEPLKRELNELLAAKESHAQELQIVCLVFLLKMCQAVSKPQTLPLIRLQTQVPVCAQTCIVLEQAATVIRTASSREQSD